ncbi:hypothetical protein ANN_14864 [Periplaneta americana]|uniref:Uncharacterized protein n=1 Tax=Periplaneta americana TaxID=6978 RepID=A0ABQ8SXH0_PERAM|nr:hypothetical protein ANN_14864 [Periplaneta americana]
MKSESQGILKKLPFKVTDVRVLRYEDQVFVKTAYVGSSIEVQVLNPGIRNPKNIDTVMELNFVNHKFFYVTLNQISPLDVGVMFPLKAYHDQALQKWMNNHPGRVDIVFQIAQIFCESYLKACTQVNAISGFRITGIVPYNPDVFNDADFVAAKTTE